MAHNNNVTFFLGPAPAAAGLSNRQLTITRFPKAGDDVMPTPVYNQGLGGTVEWATVPIPINQIWQAKLVDTKTTGEVSRPAVLGFNTGSLQFPGPSLRPEFDFCIKSMEDMSSSSSSSSQSSSSSSSNSSSSSSSSRSSQSSSSYSRSSSSTS